MMIEQMAQQILDDRGDMFTVCGYTMSDIQKAVSMAAANPVQYIQYRWDNARQEVVEFYSYTPEDWFSCEALPNMQLIRVRGRIVSRAELEGFIRDNNQPQQAILE